MSQRKKCPRSCNTCSSQKESKIERNNMIYGITGKKQAGKDTLAKALKLENPKFVVLHFADHLKALCADIFGLGDYQLNDSIGKEEDLPQGVEMDQWLYDMEE